MSSGKEGLNLSSLLNVSPQCTVLLSLEGEVLACSKSCFIPFKWRKCKQYDKIRTWGDEGEGLKHTSLPSSPRSRLNILADVAPVEEQDDKCCSCLPGLTGNNPYAPLYPVCRKLHKGMIFDDLCPVQFKDDHPNGQLKANLHKIFKRDSEGDAPRVRKDDVVYDETVGLKFSIRHKMVMVSELNITVMAMRDVRQKRQISTPLTSPRSPPPVVSPRSPPAGFSPRSPPPSRAPPASSSFRNMLSRTLSKDASPPSSSTSSVSNSSTAASSPSSAQASPKSPSSKSRSPPISAGREKSPPLLSSGKRSRSGSRSPPNRASRKLGQSTISSPNIVPVDECVRQKITRKSSVHFQEEAAALPAGKRMSSETPYFALTVGTNTSLLKSMANLGDSNGTESSGESASDLSEHVLPSTVCVFNEGDDARESDRESDSSSRELLEVEDDVIWRKELEDLNSQGFMAPFVDGYHEAVIVCSSTGIVIKFNKSATDLLGYDSEEIVGKSMLLIIPPNIRAIHHAAFMKYSKTGVKGNVFSQTLELSAYTKAKEEVSIGFRLTEIPNSRMTLAVLFDLRWKDIEKNAERKVAESLNEVKRNTR